MSTVASAVHSRKAPRPSEDTRSGTAMAARDEQFRKVWGRIAPSSDAALDSRKWTRLTQSWKLAAPSECTVSGSTNCRRAVHPRNASAPISIIAEPRAMVTTVRFTANAKARLPIDVVLAGMLMDCRLLQRRKACAGIRGTPRGSTATAVSVLQTGDLPVMGRRRQRVGE